MTQDRLKDALLRFVNQAVSRVDYFAQYPAKVIAQGGDLTLELQPDSTSLPGMSHVPIRLGIPGITVNVAPGSRVLVGFENGDPSRPIATLWEVSTLLEITITASAKVTITSPVTTLAGGLVKITDAAGKPVARIGDTVVIPGIPMVGVITSGNPNALA